MPFFLYILRCADDTYYVGRTNNVEKRMKEHNASKRGAKYTRGRRPVQLIYSEEHESLSAVLKREWRIKQLTRAEKEELCSGQDT